MTATRATAALREPDSPEALAAALTEAAALGHAVLPVGHGSRAGLGADPAPVDVTLSTRRLDRVVAYDPADLTITVQAGLPLADLDDLLASHDQWLPHQAWRRRGTVGGLLASGADGAVDLRWMRARDDLVGARLALADGSLAQGRGRVVKNVAGFDTPRLMVGSLGTLAVLVECSFKLAPRPEAAGALVAGFSDPRGALAAARRVLDGPSRPSFVDVFVGGCEAQVAVGFDGRSARVEGELARTGTLLGAQGMLRLDAEQERDLRRRLDDPVAALAGAAGDGPVVRWAGRPSRLGLVLAAARERLPGLRVDARPGLGLAWFAPARDADLPELLATLRRDGHAVLVSGGEALRRDPDLVWGAPGPDLTLMRRVKRALDPDGVLVAGRFVGGL